MPGSLLHNVPSLAHWEIALRTGVGTAALVLLLTFTPLARAFRDRWGNALAVGLLTAAGDAWSHRDHYGIGWVEPIVTGLVSAAFALAALWLFEDRARRIRGWWAARRR